MFNSWWNKTSRFLGVLEWCALSGCQWAPLIESCCGRSNSDAHFLLPFSLLEFDIIFLHHLRPRCALRICHPTSTKLSFQRRALVYSGTVYLVFGDFCGVLEPLPNSYSRQKTILRILPREPRILLFFTSDVCKFELSTRSMVGVPRSSACQTCLYRRVKVRDCFSFHFPKFLWVNSQDVRLSRSSSATKRNPDV